MKKKYTRKRLDILYDYKDSVLRFGLVALFAAAMSLTFILVIKDNPYNMKLLPFASVALLWFISFFLLLRETYNKHMLLWLASLLIWVYSITLDEVIIGLVLPLIVFSFIYEIIFRFYLGAGIKFRVVKYSWCLENEK